jgi:hypothetical protein
MTFNCISSQFVELGYKLNVNTIASWKFIFEMRLKVFNIMHGMKLNITYIVRNNLLVINNYLTQIRLSYFV